MDDGFLSKLERFGAAHWQPVTFLERGVSMAFTTPMLLGARVRPMDRSGQSAGLELVIPNPSGGDGVYILPWNALPDLCAPTLHDRQIWNRVADLRAPAPARIREVSRAVAAEGYAGRDAARAAVTATAATRQSRLLTHYRLLLGLITQTDGHQALASAAEAPEQLARRARAAIATHLPDVAGGPEAAFRALEDLAEILQPGGLPGDPVQAPLPRLAAELEQLHRTLLATGAVDEVDRACAALVAASVQPTLALAGHTLRTAQALAEDLPALLRRWLADPQEVRRLAARPDWLLDGWELVLALWRDSGGEALRDMAVLVPVVPVEAGDWSGESLCWQEERDNLAGRRIVQANQDWRTGRMLQIQRRNERVRSLAA